MNEFVKGVNIENLKLFVEALKGLPEELKDKKVSMDFPFEGIYRKDYGTPGLLMYASKQLPELAALYTHPSYSFYKQCEAFAKFIGFSREEALTNWAKIFPEIWGNKEGEFVFILSQAFGLPEDSQGTNRVIIEHWEAVLNRLYLLGREEGLYEGGALKATFSKSQVTLLINSLNVNQKIQKEIGNSLEELEVVLNKLHLLEKEEKNQNSFYDYRLLKAGFSKSQVTLILNSLSLNQLVRKETGNSASLEDLEALASYLSALK